MEKAFHHKKTGITFSICLGKRSVHNFLHSVNMAATLKAPVLQILLENHELCKYAKISLHIHIIVGLNKNIGLIPHMFTVLLRKQTIRVSAIGIYLF